MGDSLVRATTTAFSLEAEHDSGNIDKTQTKTTSNEPSSQGTSSGDGPRREDTMRNTSAHTRYERKVLNLEDELKRTKTAQQPKIDGLERSVKKLKKKQRSKTHKLKRLYKVGLTARVISSSDNEALDNEDTSKQRRIDEIDANEDIALVSTHDDVSNQDNIFQDKGIKDVGEEEVVEVVTNAKMIIDAVTDAAQVTTAIADIPVSAAETIVTTALTIIAESTKINTEVTQAPKRKEVMIQEPEETTTTKIASSQQSQKPKALKNKSFAEIQELFDKAMKSVNTFVDFRTELVEESSKKVKAEITQEESLKRAGHELE
nr:hypothetical protein [Tanacetum cinerariifolium]